MDTIKMQQLRSRSNVSTLKYKEGWWQGRSGNTYFRVFDLPDAVRTARRIAASNMMRCVGYDDRAYNPWLKQYLSEATQIPTRLD